MYNFASAGMPKLKFTSFRKQNSEASITGEEMDNPQGLIFSFFDLN